MSNDGTEPLKWQWERVLQLAANALPTAGAAQNESDSLAISAATAWLLRRERDEAARLRYVTQYVPRGSLGTGERWGDWADLDEYESLDEAKVRITVNITGWREVPKMMQGGRPRRYRIIKREVRENLVSELSDAEVGNGP
jgi:hypothetical protein